MQDPKNCHLGTIAQLCLAISSQVWHIVTIGKKTVKQQCLPHMFSKYGELQPTIGSDLLAQRVLRLGSVTAQHFSSGRQPNCAALNRGRHLYWARRLSRWSLAHISSLVLLQYFNTICQATGSHLPSKNRQHKIPKTCFPASPKAFTGELSIIIG